MTDSPKRPLIEEEKKFIRVAYGSTHYHYLYRKPQQPSESNRERVTVRHIEKGEYKRTTCSTGWRVLADDTAYKVFSSFKSIRETRE
jgi:hypothetical protein